MARRPQRESISKVDTAWLRMEQPTNLMMITGVIVLEQGLDYERLLRTVEQRFLAFKRFRQKAVDGPAGAYWELDEDFDLRAHVRRVALPEPADRRELEILVSDLASMPLDHSRPLWQFHLVENYEAGPAIIVRIHHCIADGIALVQVFLSLTDDRPDAPPAPDDPQRWTRERSQEAPVFRRLMEPAREGLDFVVHVGQKALQEGARMVQDPARAGHYAAEAGDMMGELAHALALPNDPPTPLKGPLGPRKLAAWTDSLPLEEVKVVSKAFGCTVNDVLIATATGALRAYLVEEGMDPERLEDVRATVPVNLRPLEHALELGNHFGLVFLDLPLSAPNPLQRLYLVHERMNELKASKQAAVTFGFLAALGMAPSKLQKPVLDLLSQKATTVLTNVPGPQHPMYLAGARMREIMFWVPQNGSIGLGISILSYDGQVFFGLIADRKRMPEPNRVVQRVSEQFEQYTYLSLLLSADGSLPPMDAAARMLDGTGE